jgi:hypothetical protein
MKRATISLEHPGSKSPALTMVILAVLFAAGALHWILFLNYGNLTFKAQDWGKEYIYYSLIQQAISTGQMPYHISVAFHGTPRFLALPEVNLSPQILLLPLMSIGRFILVNIIILYSVGFVGCLLIKHRYNLSLMAFSTMFLLFNFNGHLTAHIGVGHSMWAGYFLLPLFFLFTSDMLEGKSPETGPIKIAFVLFAIVLQGGFHIFVWCTTFLILILIFNWKYLRPLLFTLVSTAALCAFRLIPAAFALVGKREKFIWSYPTLRDLLDAMITIREQTPDRLRPWGTPGWWEYDIYIGVIGLIIIVYFGIYLRFSKRPELEDHAYRAFDLPLLITALFSLSYFHAFLTRVPIPLLRSERVAARFLALPLVILIFISTIRFDRVQRGLRQNLKVRILSIAGLVVMSLGFVDHSYLWSVTRLEQIYRNRVVDLTIPKVLSQHDAPYKILLWTSTAVSVAAIVILVTLAYRRTRPKRVV